jgi:uncharacterized protein (DUF4415 family)
MRKRSQPTRTDRDNPEWTKGDFAAARPAREVLPENVVAALPKRRPGQRGPQKAPTKIAVALRLDRKVVEHFRASGEGWQTRINDVLARSIAQPGRTKRIA